MALQSKTITGSTNNSNWTFKLEVVENSTSKDKNTSSVTVTAYIGRSSSSSYMYGASISCDVSVTGCSNQTISYSNANRVDISGGGWLNIGSKTFEVPHNNDGEKSITISASFSNNVSPSSGSASGTMILTKIPRASGVACSSPNIGDTAVITIDKKSSSFTNTVTYKIGTLSGTIATKTTSTVLSLTTSNLAEDIYNQIPNSTYIQGTITCTTYSGNTQIGDSQSCNFRLYAVKEDVKPNIIGTIIDTNEKTIEITQDSNKLIKYVSKPKVTIDATPIYNATIESYSINLNDGQSSNTQENTFNSIGSNVITINATDSRGYDNPTDIDLTDRMIDYIELHIDNISLDRPEETSNEVILNVNGVWFNNKFNDTLENNLTIKFQYKKSSESSWIEGGTLTPTISGNTFLFENYSLGELFDYQEEYQLKFIVEDVLMIVGDKNTDIIVVPKGQEAVAIGEEGGWLYGLWYLNEQEILNYDIVDEW